MDTTTNLTDIEALRTKGLVAAKAWDLKATPFKVTIRRRVPAPAYSIDDHHLFETYNEALALFDGSKGNVTLSVVERPLGKPLRFKPLVSKGFKS